MNILDNPAWTALTTLQAHRALGGDLARRYPDDLAPIAAVGQRNQAALDHLAMLVQPGDSVSLPATLEDLVPLVRSPLTLKFARRLVQMVYAAGGDQSAVDTPIRVLSEPDSAEMLALALLTQPGPFRSRTFTFGTFVGIHVDGVLAAMGGQRMHLPGYRELSGICTHPDFRGRGFGRAIVAHLIDITSAEGLTPFLHVEEQNHTAQALYRALGFVERARPPLVVVEHLKSEVLKSEG